MTVVMARCPHCGVELLASLVEAIKNPSRPESCPRVERMPGKVTADTSVLSFAAALILSRVKLSLENLTLPAPTRAGDGRDSSPVPRPFPGGSPPEHSSPSVRAPEHARPGD